MSKEIQFLIYSTAVEDVYSFPCSRVGTRQGGYWEVLRGSEV